MANARPDAYTVPAGQNLLAGAAQGSGGGAPALDFSVQNNSQYLALQPGLGVN